MINEGLKQCQELTSKAMALNNALVNHDKYCEILQCVQQIMIDNNVQTKILKPITDVKMCATVSSHTL